MYALWMGRCILLAMEAVVLDRTEWFGLLAVLVLTVVLLAIALGTLLGPYYGAIPRAANAAVPPETSAPALEDC